MGAVILVEIEVTSPTGVASTLRFSDRAIRPFPPTDGLRPNVRFDARLKESPAIRRLLFDDLATLKPSRGVGALTLSNADRALSPYEGHAWGEITVLRWIEGTPSASAAVILRGLCAQPAYPPAAGRPAQVRVALGDYSAEASNPVQPTLYAGSNSETVLYEGTAEALKDTPKPLAFGDLRQAHIPAPQVNAAEQAHQLHDGQVQGEVALFDRGDAFGLVDDGDLAGAAFDAATPAAAHSVTDLGRGLVKFNGAPIGQFTVGFKGDAAGGYVETAGPVLERLLLRAKILPGRIGASVGALAAPAVIGFYADAVTRLEDALAFVAAGAPAAVLPDREGVWQAIAFGPPAADADFALGDHQVIACSADETSPAPVGEVRIGWGRIWRTFTAAELAAELVGADAQARLAAEYRWAKAEDVVVKQRFAGTARTVEVLTALRELAPAEALAAKLLSLFGLKADGRPRRFWRVTVPVEVLLAHKLGETCAFTYAPEGISGHFLLVGEEPLRPSRDQGVWTLWG
ncbi:MAG: hypothetical protein AB1942_21115 [Pseudomonadota bacterium]